MSNAQSKGFHSSMTRILQIPLLACLFLAAAGQTCETHASEKPKLCVVVVIDQLRCDLVTRYEDHFGNDGFKRLMREGGFWPNAYFRQGSSATGPGHATISTGKHPRQHGIVGNRWPPDPAKSKQRHAVDDPSCSILGLDVPDYVRGKSPRAIIGRALGDELKLADTRSRVFSVALKDRAAIFLGGRRPDAAFWWNPYTGEFRSSTYYMDQLPPYVASFNRKRWCDRFVGATWDHLLPHDAYDRCLKRTRTEPPFKVAATTSLPYRFLPTNAPPDRQFYFALYASPFGNDIALEMTRRVLENEKIGQGNATDLLFVGFSANDVAGHVFGPNSPEIMDLTVRTDRHLATLLNMLDEQVGPGHYHVALTGDHGVTTPPETAAHITPDVKRFDADQLLTDLNDHLVEKHGSLPDSRSYTRARNIPWIYLDQAIDQMTAGDRKAVLATAVAFLRSRDFVQDAFSSVDLAGPAPSTNDHHRLLAWRAYHPVRSGHLYVQIKPGCEKAGSNYAGHNNALTHDRHVPIFIAGPGVKSGRYFQPADPADIAVTLAALLGIEPPLESTGRVLHEAIGN